MVGSFGAFLGRTCCSSDFFHHWTTQSGGICLAFLGVWFRFLFGRPKMAVSCLRVVVGFSINAPKWGWLASSASRRPASGAGLL